MTLTKNQPKRNKEGTESTSLLFRTFSIYIKFPTHYYCILISKNKKDFLVIIMLYNMAPITNGTFFDPFERVCICWDIKKRRAHVKTSVVYK